LARHLSGYDGISKEPCIESPAIGQTLIRGLDTTGKLVRREPCYLLTWITMKLCRHSYAADGSDRMIGKAPSRYRHRGWFTAAMIDSACFWSGNGVKGHTCRWRFSPTGENTTACPLTERHGIPSRTGKKPCFFPCRPGRGQGVKGTGPLAGS
jgi:hypothetical protein